MYSLSKIIGDDFLKIHLRNGVSFITNMKYGDFYDLMQDANFDFLIVVENVEDDESKMFVVKKESIDLIELEVKENE